MLLGVCDGDTQLSFGPAEDQACENHIASLAISGKGKEGSSKGEWSRNRGRGDGKRRKLEVHIPLQVPYLWSFLTPGDSWKIPLKWAIGAVAGWAGRGVLGEKTPI